LATVHQPGRDGKVSSTRASAMSSGGMYVIDEAASLI
jgi:hypothetical protein